MIGWILLPLLTMGLLAWLMPVVAAAARQRRSWAIAGAVLALAVAAGVILPVAAAGFFILAAWFGGTIYGALQRPNGS